MIKQPLKLSELPDDAEVSIEESSTAYTVAELKFEILELGEAHHESPNWYIIKNAIWTPCAESLVDRLIEDRYDEMYEGWDDRASDCVNKEIVEKIQALLNEMFEPVRGYWIYGDPVEIDIFPIDKESFDGQIEYGRT